MKKILLSLIAIATISLSSFGQAPEGFKYQAVVRDAGGLISNNQAVGMRLTVQQGSIGGTPVYTETFSTTTNAYGLVNLEIGTGTTTDDFTAIDWANGPYFMETAVDFLGGMTWVVMGTSQLMSVPYALHSKTAENVINDLVDDADADPANELQDWSNLPNIPADFSDNIDDVDDADADPVNELQTISEANGVLSLSNGGGSVTLTDADATNELQTLSVSATGDTLYLQNGGFVIIPGISAANASGGGGGTYPTGSVFCASGATAIVDVTNPTTGAIWMDRNLGATQAATSSTDADAYGDLYQWGRFSDGHQCRTSNTTATLSSVDQPAHGDFILKLKLPLRLAQPTKRQFMARRKWYKQSMSKWLPYPNRSRVRGRAFKLGVQIHRWGLLPHPLKLPMAGSRDDSSGSLSLVGDQRLLLEQYG